MPSSRSTATFLTRAPIIPILIAGATTRTSSPLLNLLGTIFPPTSPPRPYPRQLIFAICLNGRKRLGSGNVLNLQTNETIVCLCLHHHFIIDWLEEYMLSHERFIETNLKTKFSDFNIRAYQDPFGKETIVLWTKKLNVMMPPLVRVHSECITGDLLGSLHCDCGNQLTKSLKLIAKEGGVIIYLRQEGRGIGLFEKLKSYQLQSKGHDTFEANVLLGHQPDSRTYEMVKTVLNDLGIGSIRLLTNNPSKVSEIAKSGIEIVEQVPIISRSNKHNKKYLETKKNKFQHFQHKSANSYIYQFNLEEANQVHALIDFAKLKKKDPLLKLGVAITARKESLFDKQEVTRIESIISACTADRDFSPAIHYSFKDSTDILADVHKIKSLWPSIQRLQINDISGLTVSILKKICDHFLVDIPLSDDNFQLVHKDAFRKLVKKNNLLLMLDNSRGRGLRSSREEYSQKIEVLFKYGLNRIALCGGFGPDNLSTYFSMRRHYKVNFSIDAESNLKTAGKVDLEKVKLYLLQLIRFDDPKIVGIEQTKRLLEMSTRSESEIVHINGCEFSIHPNVFHPGCFPATAWFSSELSSLIKDDEFFCEVGCGSGVISCLAALSVPSLQVTCTDINPLASKNTEYNVEKLGLTSRVSVLTGDVLDSVIPQPLFDTIFWLLPFGFLDPGDSINRGEEQVFDPGYRAVRKFFQTARHFLKPTGKLLIGFSSDLGHKDLLEEIARNCSIDLIKLKMATLKEEDMISFEILEGRFF